QDIRPEPGGAAAGKPASREAKGSRVQREGVFAIAELPRLVSALESLSKTAGWRVGTPGDLASLGERGQKRAREWGELPLDDAPLIADATAARAPQGVAPGMVAARDAKGPNTSSRASAPAARALSAQAPLADSVASQGLAKTTQLASMSRQVRVTV